VGDPMLPLASIAKLIVMSLFQILTDPLFWAVVLLVGLQVRRVAVLRQRLFGVPVGNQWRQVVGVVGLGIAGGLVGSWLVVFTGVSVTGIGIGYVWGAALLLMLFSPRFLCFAYAGGLISISSVLFGFPRVDVPELLGLVAVLHLVESCLIALGGHHGAVPVYTRHASGRVVGAFYLQKFWPIPITVFMLFPLTGGAALPDLVSMPDWWPLIKPAYQGDLTKAVFMLMPVVAGLGYTDLAVTTGPAAKSRRSAGYLVIYSLALLSLAILASYQRELTLVAALFAPLGHEFLIRLGRGLERRGKPLFLSSGMGVMVLDVLPGSKADRIGLRSGDVITAVNGMIIATSSELAAALAEPAYPMTVDYLDSTDGEPRQITTRWNSRDAFGIIPVPEPGDLPMVELGSGGLLTRWLRNLRSGRPGDSLMQ